MEQRCGNSVNKGQLAVSLAPASATKKLYNQENGSTAFLF